MYLLIYTMEFNMPSPRIQTTVSHKFYQLAKQHHIQWAEALRVGISIILAEKGVSDYDNKLNIMRRLNKMRELLEEKTRQIDEIKAR